IRKLLPMVRILPAAKLYDIQGCPIARKRHDALRSRPFSKHSHGGVQCFRSIYLIVHCVSDSGRREGAMAPEHQLTFGPFRLETAQGGLWHGDHPVPLRPRALAMLRYLAAHPGRLVTKAEVQQHVWAGTHVTPTVLRVCVRDIRLALGDAALAPRYLVTV